MAMVGGNNMKKVELFLKVGQRERVDSKSLEDPWAPKSLQMVTEAMKLKDAYSLEEKLWQT